MIIVSSLQTIPLLPLPIALAIGTFDGVHLGHQLILQELKKHGTSVVLTFSNHPAEVLRNHKPTPLCSLEEKLQLFETFGVVCVIVVPFTHEFAHQSYDFFLENLKKHLPFTTLVRGKGDPFGHQNLGSESRVKALENRLEFQAIYLEKLVIDGFQVSSKRIRELLLEGDRCKASTLLGRNI